MLPKDTHYTSVFQIEQDEVNQPSKEGRSQQLHYSSETAYHPTAMDSMGGDLVPMALNPTDRFFDWLNEKWVTELACLGLAIASIGAMAGLCSWLDNKELVSLGWRISPNTLLSILTTACKAGMLAAVSAAVCQLKWLFYKSSPQALGDFDKFGNATQGIWGSFMFVMTMSIRRGGISRFASVGALVLLLSIAIDPFTQQILHYESDSLPQQGNQAVASIPVSRGTSDGGAILNNNGAWESIYGGMLGFNYSFPFDCIGGNCTWPTYSSLGVCSRCQNATLLVDTQYDSNEAGSPDYSSIVYSLNGTNLRLTLKNATAAADAESSAPQVYTLVKSVVSDPYPNGVTNSTIFQFLMAQLRVRFTNAQNTTQAHQSFAPSWNLTFCSMEWCAREYENVSVTNNVLSSAPPRIDRLYADPSSSCYNSSTCQQFTTTYNGTTPSNDNGTYRVSLNQDAANFRELLALDQDIGAFSNGTWDIANAFSVTTTLFWNVDIVYAMQRATSTFSDYFRINDQEAKITGTVWLTATYIKVRWGWLSLPIALVACSTVFVLVVIVAVSRTPGSSKLLWKANTLPLFFHPLNAGLDRVSRKPQTMAGMNGMGDALKAQLRENSAGDLLFQVDPLSRASTWQSRRSTNKVEGMVG